MRLPIALAGVALLGCSATNLALLNLSTATGIQAEASLAQQQREAEKEQRHQQSSKCCATKEYVASSGTWRCTGCD
jgi:hypothetical protein